MRRSCRRRGVTKLALLLVLTIVAAAGANYVMRGRASPDKEKRAQAQRAKQKNKEMKAKAREKEEERKREAAREIVFIDMGSFLVNLISRDDLHYLKVAVSVGVVKEKGKKKKKGGHGGDGDEEAKLPPRDDALARDTIVRVLSQQSFEELRLRGPGVKLKKAVRMELARTLKDTKVASVLFTSFVMQ